MIGCCIIVTKLDVNHQSIHNNYCNLHIYILIKGQKISKQHKEGGFVWLKGACMCSGSAIVFVCVDPIMRIDLSKICTCVCL